MVGMEAAAISATLKIVGNKLAPLVITKYSFIVGVEKNLQELQDLAEQINCWLQTVGDKAIGDDPSFKWLKNLKDVAYDVDDAVDEFQLEAEKHDTYGKSGILSKCLHGIPKSFKSRWKAAKKIKEITKRFAVIVKQRTDISVIANSLQPVSQSVQHINQTTVEIPLSIMDAASVLGRDQDKNKIITKIVETKVHQDIEIVSIIGLGGSGKTTLAKLIFNDADTIEMHFEVRLWVHVSQEFDIAKLVEKLFEAVTKDKSNRHPLQHMSETISKGLTAKKFLLVLDDVWIDVRIQWEQFREKFMVHLKGGAPTSKILLTTRSRIVAEVVESTYLFDLPMLSPDDSWQLFAHRFRATIPSEFEEVGKDIVKKCGGLPLGIIALACVLRDKKLKEEWEAIRDNSLLDVEGAEDGIFARLRLSYFHLPSHLKPCFAICSLFPKGYKMDKDKLIDQWIAHDMIAVEDGVTYLEYTADKYFRSLVQLSFLQDVEKNHQGREECRMHDLVDDLARSILGDKISLVVPNEASSSTKSYRYFSLTEQTMNPPPKNLFLKARAIYVDEGSHETNFGKALKKARHLRSVTVECNYNRALPTAVLQIENLKYLEISSLHCKEIPEAISDLWSLQALHLKCRNLVQLLESIGKLQKLRTLNLSPCEQLKCLPDSIGDCKMISRIDLCNCNNFTVLPNSIGTNKNLRVLRLGGTKIKRLPSSITILRNLECLYLYYCQELVEFPEGIGNLEKLEALNLVGCENLRGMPVGMGQLSRLQKLELFVVSEDEKCARISELANIGTNSEYLTIRGVVRVMEPDDAHKACLKQKTNLQSLYLEWNTYDADEANTELVEAALDGLEPPSWLKDLTIDGYFGRQYARWMQDDQVGDGLPIAYFPFLSVMRLWDLPNLKHLRGLAELPCLEELDLSNMPSLESISGGPFPSLVKLFMKGMPSLGEVRMIAAERTIPDGEEGGGCSNRTPHHLGQVLRVGTCFRHLDIYDCHKLQMYIYNCPELLVMPSLRSSLQCLGLLSSEQLLQSPQGQCEGSSLSNSFSHLTLQVYRSSAIRELREWLGELWSLQELTIRDFGSLTTLPLSMGRLTSLQVLKIEWFRALKQLPECLGHLASLRSLKVYECSAIQRLPESLGELRCLQELTIEFSKFHTHDIGRASAEAQWRLKPAY